MSKFNMKVTPEIEKLTQICRENDKLDLSLYGKYDVKRGLRDLNGKGVLTGLTNISSVVAFKESGQRRSWTEKRFPAQVSFLIAGMTLRI